MEHAHNDLSWIFCPNCKHSLNPSILVKVISPAPPALEILLNCTDRISAAQAVSVQALLKRTSSEAERLDEAIGTLEDTLSLLRDSRKEPVKTSQQLKAVLSPIRRLPTEILLEIFHLCVSPGQDQCRPISPLNLCHVAK